jgi:hypothetical protein
VARPHPITLPAFAEHRGARVRGDGIVACQAHRPRWDPLVEQERGQGARQCPGRPAALGQHAMLGRDMPLGLIPHGAEQVGDGPSPGGQHGRQP